ncbi:MAG: glycosyltransferase family 4 protein [Gemmatimonadales bacterium]
MKIALVVPGGVDASGTERVIPAFVWLIERLARRHDVHVFALHQQPEPADWPLFGAQVHNIGTVGSKRRRFFERFAAEHRAGAFDLVHALFGGAGLYAAIAGWRHRLPVLLHLAGGEPLPRSSDAYGTRVSRRGRFWLRVATTGASRVTVATLYMQRLVEAMNVETELVPLGVALDRWPLLAPRPRDPSRPVRLLHIADLRPVKDQPMLLTAIGLLRDRGHACELDMAGFDTTDGTLQRSVEAARVADITRWHGLLGRTELHRLAARADILVHSSRHEAGPLAVLEGAIAGVPTVGTAVGHVADWAPEAAVAVPVGDADAMARAIAALLDDEPRRLRLAAEAQRRAIACDADHTARCVERIYEELAGAAGRVSGGATIEVRA